MARHASGPAPPQPATIKSNSYTPHGYGGAYEPLPRHSHSNSAHSYPFAGYEPYEPWGTGSLRSESALAVNSGSDVGANSVTATGGAPLGGANLERKASIKKRAGVPWPLVARGSLKSRSSKGSRNTRNTERTEKTDRSDRTDKTERTEKGGVARERSDRRDTRDTRDTHQTRDTRETGTTRDSHQKSDSSCSSGGSPVTATSGYSSGMPWGLQAHGAGAQGDTLRTLSTLSTVSVPLSAVGVPSGQAGPAPFQGDAHSLGHGHAHSPGPGLMPPADTVAEEDLMDPPPNPARAQRARSQDPRALRLHVRENSNSHRHTN